MVLRPVSTWTQRASSHAQAKRSLTTHVFVPGRGYFQFSAQANAPVSSTVPRPKSWMLIEGDVVGTTCAPPANTSANSRHYLRPPRGAQPLLFTWIAAEKAWAPLTRDGKRMAFTADYLASHGWQYLKSA